MLEGVNTIEVAINKGIPKDGVFISCSDNKYNNVYSCKAELHVIFEITKGVKIVDGGLHFIFSFTFFFFFFFFYFLLSIFRTTQVRVHQSRCHISHKLMA